MPDMSRLREVPCPACGHQVAIDFFDGGAQPLATLAWPKTVAEAEQLAKLPLDFVRCLDCGHVFNRSFNYQDVPYSDKPNLMFNKGKTWKTFLSWARDEMLSNLPENATIVEIGHGDGSFISGLAEAMGQARCIGFDPHGTTHKGGRVEFRAELFLPETHLAELKPDLIISRHVLEHLINPLGFLQHIYHCAENLGQSLRVYLEVPCIDNAITSKRSVDFYYEHSSQFTSQSFQRMLERSKLTIDRIGYGYGKEVIYGFASIPPSHEGNQLAHQSSEFLHHSTNAIQTIATQLNQLLDQKKSIAIWGGTGKSAAFIARFGLDRVRFPVVIDSDSEKIGTFVPGTAQVIRDKQYLLENPVDIIIIPPQWRARDIELEMNEAQITCDCILIEHLGRLIDLNSSGHPY